MVKPARLYLDIHVLQTVPPSCVNRDDTGSPKTAVYGGANRARVSSQSWKKAVRNMFQEEIDEGLLALRTKRIVSVVAEELVKAGYSDDALGAAQCILEAAGLKIRSVEKGTDALFFISRAQAKALAALVTLYPDVASKKPSVEAKKQAKAALQEHPGLEVALFGRMVADDPSLNTDACAQVAHAISTHKVSTEYDYFTAVDDLAPEDNAGAGHLGTVEFNSSTLYRYATVAVHSLYEHLAEDTAKALSWFVEAFIKSMPTGRQNTFAHRTLPDVVLIAVRDDQPVNLVGAFEKPVTAGRDQAQGYVEASASALVRHAQRLNSEWLREPLFTLAIGDLLKDLTQPTTLKLGLEELEKNLATLLADGGTV